MIDIHMHTIYSDGDKTVEEVLKMCEDKKLEYISITDHDTCKQYDDETLKYNKIFSGKIIKGSELHAVIQNNIIIKKCANCGKLFVPDKTDQIYCNNLYKDTGKTCKEIGALNKRKEKVENSKI